VLREYVCPARDQLFLMPVSMREWIPEGHLAWFVLDVVEQIDTRVLHRRPAGAVGRRPYLPEMMLAMILYGYCCGVRFSRRLEAACRTDAAFRVICGGMVPDHATIARFVVDHERALEDLFVDGLRLCAAAGVADLSVVALDGTKIAADASIARNRSGEWIRGEIVKLMAQTGQDAHEAPGGQLGLDGVVPSGEIASPTGRLGRLEAALAVVDAARPRRARRPGRAASSTDASRRTRRQRSRAQRSITRSRASGSLSLRPRSLTNEPPRSAARSLRPGHDSGSIRPPAPWSAPRHGSRPPARPCRKRIRPPPGERT
jgi:transposase